MNPSRELLVLAVIFAGCFSSLASAQADDAAPGLPERKVRFGRDVLPILSDRCFHCHGPDATHREAELRLDVENSVKRDRNGARVVSAGNPKASVLWQRITTNNKDQQMPPADSHRKPLSPEERDVIRLWIKQGAKWGKHWAFEKPLRPSVPQGSKHPIDAFIRAKLKSEGLTHSPLAKRHTQLRRLSFDLTGLPPQSSEVQDFDWKKSIEQKLASQHHGERLAMWWLDAARYSDTDGYQQDKERTNWPWRDWVVQAFNKNMPFDQFTVEQFAGDLLPQATPEQILATGFHRHHMTNGEGGRIKEESRVDYVIDRLNTTGTVWLGLTLGCTQCHDHKFDPVSQRDYYGLYAFFNSIDEDGSAGTAAKPYLKYQSPLAGRAVKEAQAHLETCKPRLEKAQANAEKRFAQWLKDTRSKLTGDYLAWSVLHPTKIESAEGTTFNQEPSGIVQTSGPSLRQDDYRITFASPKHLQRITGWKLKVFPHVSHTQGKLARGKSGEFILTNVKLLVRRKGESQVRDIEMRSAIADFEKSAKGRAYGNVRDTLDDDPRNGWTTETGDATTPHTAVFELQNPIDARPDEELTFVFFHRSTVGDANIGRFQISVTDQRGDAVRTLKPAPLERLARTEALSAELRKRLLQQFLFDDVEYQTAKIQYDDANRQLSEVKRAAGQLNVQVLAERKQRRETHVLVRGVWDVKGEQVKRGGLPAVFPLSTSQPLTRLDFAKWIVSPDNPLTPRVIVNHLWQMMFGAGLVRTPEDFGLQGATPTHPELLDWLAVELVESKWNLRHILRLIVTSETYRQSSRVTPQMLERDPENRLLARAPRFRLPAWMIRDNALRVAGLLNPSLGGPPIKPWQPKGVWQEIFMGRFTYRPSVGPAQYRRTLYAYWRRSSAPTFLFDSAQRRVCEVRIRRTNTPLHALTLLNDMTMLEASRVLAQTNDGIDRLGRRVLSRSLESDELAVFNRAYQKAIAFYREHPEDAVELLTVGQQPPVTLAQAPELAAKMTIASMMLNLDEAMTHE